MKPVSRRNLSVEALRAVVLMLASLSLLAGCRDEPSKAVSNIKVYRVGVILSGTRENAKCAQATARIPARAWMDRGQGPRLRVALCGWQPGTICWVRGRVGALGGQCHRSGYCCHCRPGDGGTNHDSHRVCRVQCPSPQGLVGSL